MEDILQQAFNSGNVTAIVCAVAVYILIYIQRNSTKATRDKDSQELHDENLKMRFEIDQLKHNDIHKEEILNDLRDQLNILNTNLVKLAVTIEKMEKSNEGKR